MADRYDVKVSLKFDRAARVASNAAILEAVTDVFEQDILPEAAANSPYLTGHNARSITTEVHQDGKTGFVVARIFTQSGYGGWLEVGAWGRKARAYIYPAFQKFAAKIGALCARRINAVQTKVKVLPR